MATVSNLSLVFRSIRGFFRLIGNFFVNIRLNCSLILNNVQHGDIKCNGMPYIAVVPGGTCVLGNNLTMNNGVRFNPIGYNQPCYIVVVKGAKLTIGENVGMSQASLICHYSITIGNNVKLGSGVKVYDTDFHSLKPDFRKSHILDMQNKKTAPVVICDDVFIGAGSIILKGITIGKNSVVGAGSVVTKNIPANQIWAGNPAKYIKDLPQ